MHALYSHDQLFNSSDAFSDADGAQSRFDEDADETQTNEVIQIGSYTQQRLNVLDPIVTICDPKTTLSAAELDLETVLSPMNLNGHSDLQNAFHQHFDALESSI